MATLTTDDLEFIRDLNPATVIQLGDAIALQQTIALSEQVNHATIQQLLDFIAETFGTGAIVSFGTTIPANSVGKDGDVFVLTTTGVIYSRELGEWTAKVDLTTATELTAAIAAHVAEADPHPTYLTQAEATALFAPIQGAAQGGLRYNLNLTTTSPPAAGQVRFNNATIASVTQIFIHESDRNNAAQAQVLDAIALGTRIQIAQEDNEEVYGWFRATAAPTDNGTWRTIPVAFISAAGTFTAGEVSIDLLQIQAPSSGGGAGGIGLTRTFSATTTAGADDGTLRLNDVDPSSATSIFISESTIELNGQAALLSKIAVGNLVQITDLSNGKSSTYRLDGAVDNGSFRTLTVAWLFGPAVAGDFAGEVLFQWLPDNSTPGSSLTVAEVDGAPSFTATTIQFPNGTLTDQGGGVARYTPTEGGGGGGELTTSVITAAPSPPTAGNLYICNASTQLDFGSPSGTLTPGALFGVGNSGTGGFKLRAASGQVLRIGNTPVNSAAKFIQNTNQFSICILRAITSTDWIVERSQNIAFGEDIASFTKVLLRFNETAGASSIADVVDAGRVITLESGATTATGGRFNNQLSLDPSGRSCSFTVSDDLGTLSFCVEFWIRAISTAASSSTFEIFRGTTSLLELNHPSGADGVQPILNVNSGLLFTASGSPNLVTGGTFRHIAVTRSGSTFRYFVEGTERGSGTSTFDFGTADFTIRLGNNRTQARPWRGGMDEFRLTIGDPVYTANFTPPAAEFTYP